jgi:hypothetical protein
MAQSPLRKEVQRRILLVSEIVELAVMQDEIFAVKIPLKHPSMLWAH